MNSHKPTSFKIETPPEIHIPNRSQLPEELEEEYFEIKNPILSNLFHYGMIGILLTIVFVVSGLFIGIRFLRRGFDDSLAIAIIAILVGGGIGVFKIFRWCSSKDYDH